jgi:hypothetical protein
MDNHVKPVYHRRDVPFPETFDEDLVKDDKLRDKFKRECKRARDLKETKDESYSQ